MYSWCIASTHILSLPEQYADINHKVVLVYNYCCEADHVATYIYSYTCNNCNYCKLVSNLLIVELHA